MSNCLDTGSSYHPPRCSCIQNAAKSFPKTFGLRGFLGERFRISLDSSYFGGKDNSVLMLYTEVKRGDSWHDFAKGTKAELLNQIVRL
jgi:hypothetical protein